MLGDNKRQPHDTLWFPVPQRNGLTDKVGFMLARPRCNTMILHPVFIGSPAPF